jgi:hypothetical protein
MQFMQEQLQQMQNESELTFNQIKLVKEQLNIEIAARIDSQVCFFFLLSKYFLSIIYFQNKNKLLIERNRELLTHIQQLLLYAHELEMKLNNNNNKNFELLQVFNLIYKISDCYSLFLLNSILREIRNLYNLVYLCRYIKSNTIIVSLRIGSFITRHAPKLGKTKEYPAFRLPCDIGCCPETVSKA